MRTILKLKNKKALSEIVAYVLLIVMSLSLASGVYIWLKHIVPPDKETCSEDISLSIKTYNCNTITQHINLTIENKGFFNVAGFFIRGSNQTDNLPIVLLSQENPSTIKGRYDFNNNKLAPSTFETMEFKYDNTAPLKKIQIQPFVLGNKTKTILLCPQGIINEEISNCN